MARVYNNGITQFYLPPTHVPYLPLLTSPLVGTHCAYPRRDGQAGLTWVAAHVSITRWSSRSKVTLIQTLHGKYSSIYWNSDSTPHSIICCSGLQVFSAGRDTALLITVVHFCMCPSLLCPSVCLSVCHTRGPYLNDSKYQNTVSTPRQSDVYRFLRPNFVHNFRDSPRTTVLKRGTPSKVQIW